VIGEVVVLEGETLSSGTVMQCYRTGSTDSRPTEW